MGQPHHHHNNNGTPVDYINELWSPVTTYGMMMTQYIADYINYSSNCEITSNMLYKKRWTVNILASGHILVKHILQTINHLLPPNDQIW